MENVITHLQGARSLLEAAFAPPVQAPIPVIEQPGDGALMDNANGQGNGSGSGAVDEQFDAATSVNTDEMRIDAAAVVGEWADTDTLDEGEGYGDRLYALIVGTASEGDDELTDDESEYAAGVGELVGDYLEGKGIDAGDIDALLDDFDNDVAARVHDALLDKMPSGDEAMMDDTDKFVHGEEDASMMDATYRKVVAIRAGKKVRIKKRIGGTVRLTAGQKSAVRKMQRKAFSGTAKRNRAKSMRIRMKLIGK